MYPVQPWLVQRASIIHPLSPKSSTLSQSLRLDYMGSAEFEFGALPRSLRRIRDIPRKGEITIRIVSSIRQQKSHVLDGVPLRVLSVMQEEEFSQYVVFLNKLRANEIRTKEWTNFDSKDPSTDFWWDIDNDVMFSFDEAYMRRLPLYLENSFKVLEPKP